MTDSVNPSIRERVSRVLERHALEWGLAPIERERFERRAGAVEEWIRSGRHAGMEWLARTAGPRTRPWEEWPWARSFLVVKLPYGLPAPLPRGSRPEIAGYARGRDYHYRMDGTLKAVRADLESEFPGLRCFQFCDDQHLPEAELAVAAGLGWRGKNTLVLTRRGSAFHLGGLLLSLEGVDPPREHPAHCGSCTACMDACPASAFDGPGLLDARRCLSHWSIEDRSTSEGPAAEAARSEVFGCDICQQACPWNRKAMTENVNPERWPSTWEEWVDVCRPGGGFQSLFTKTPLRRAGRHKFLKTLLRALGNSDPDMGRNLSSRALETETYPSLVEWLRAAASGADSRDTPSGNAGV